MTKHVREKYDFVGRHFFGEYVDYHRRDFGTRGIMLSRFRIYEILTR